MQSHNVYRTLFSRLKVLERNLTGDIGAWCVSEETPITNDSNCQRCSGFKGKTHTPLKRQADAFKMHGPDTTLPF